MPMTGSFLAGWNELVRCDFTLIDQLQLGDDVQPHVGEIVLEHLQKHGQKMGGGSRIVS